MLCNTVLHEYRIQKKINVVPGVSLQWVAMSILAPLPVVLVVVPNTYVVGTGAILLLCGILKLNFSRRFSDHSRTASPMIALLPTDGDSGAGLLLLCTFLAAVQPAIHTSKKSSLKILGAETPNKTTHSL